MKRNLIATTIAIGLFAVLRMPLRLGAQEHGKRSAKSQHYKLTVLPTLGGTFAEAWDGNNMGSAVGRSTLAGDMALDAFLWRNGSITDLGSLGGPSFAVSVNDRGTVAGSSNNSIPDPNGEDFCGVGTQLICLPFVWQKGVMTALATLGGNNAQANGINNRRQIVGVSETPNPDPCFFFPFQIAAAIWQNGSVQELPLLSGDQDGLAGAINDHGEVVGQTGGCLNGSAYIHAVLWRNGTPIDLGNLGGVTSNFAFDINNKSQVVGQSDLAGDTIHHPFLWKNGVMVDLGCLPGLPNGQGIGINNKGQIVGFCQDANGDDTSSVAVLWQNGTMTDLNSLIPSSSSVFLMEAFSINDRGQIAGFGHLSNGDHRGFLLTPCEENHGDAGDCGEDAAGTTGATQISAPATQGLATANQSNPELRGTANPMLGRFGGRWMRWQRSFAAQPQK